MKGLLLDFDGTIADTERHGHRVAYNRAFAELRLDWTWDDALYGELLAVAGGKERLRHYLERYRPALLEEALATGLIPRIHETKGRHFAQLSASIPLRPGILRLLREAHAAGIAIAIATTAQRSGFEALLGHFAGMRELIGVIAADDAAERKKPEPDVYLVALERLGMQARDCVAIEDSNTGLRAALAAGLTTVVTASDYTAGDDFSGAAVVLSDLGEPGRPARTLRGPAPPHGFVDVAYLEAIGRTAHPEPS